MTENKRFVGSSGGVYDRYKGDRFTWSEWEEIMRIMNNLNEKARERSKALSKLQKENEQLKNNIKEAYNNERTMIGKSVLKQLMETIQ